MSRIEHHKPISGYSPFFLLIMQKSDLVLMLSLPLFNQVSVIIAWIWKKVGNKIITTTSLIYKKFIFLFCFKRQLTKKVTKTLNTMSYFSMLLKKSILNWMMIEALSLILTNVLIVNNLKIIIANNFRCNRLHNRI